MKKEIEEQVQSDKSSSSSCLLSRMSAAFDSKRNDSIVSGLSLKSVGTDEMKADELVDELLEEGRMSSE